MALFAEPDGQIAKPDGRFNQFTQLPEPDGRRGQDPYDEIEVTLIATGSRILKENKGSCRKGSDFMNNDPRRRMKVALEDDRREIISTIENRVDSIERDPGVEHGETCTFDNRNSAANIFADVQDG